MLPEYLINYNKLQKRVNTNYNINILTKKGNSFIKKLLIVLKDFLYTND
jgi:hypothetical protein